MDERPRPDMDQTREALRRHDELMADEPDEDEEPAGEEQDDDEEPGES